MPQPQSVRVMGIAEIRGENLEVGVPDHLGQTNYAEICISVTKRISNLNKIQITPSTYLITYFQYLYLNYLRNLQQTHKIMHVWQTNIRNMLRALCSLGPAGDFCPRPPVPPTPNPGYATDKHSNIPTRCYSRF